MKPNKVVIYPYKMGSEGGKLLAKELGVLRVRMDGDYKPTKDDVVINWGNGHNPCWNYKLPLMLNTSKAICNSVNKVDMFYLFKDHGVTTPVWTQYKDWALKWIAKGEWAVARTELEGFDGSGIKLVKESKDLPDCNLYSKYVPIDREFRFYVFKDKVIDVLDKKRKIIAKADPYIHTESLGWVFCQNPEWWPKPAEQEAVKAVKALGLDFGGVDIIWNKEKETSYVLEVNTAPGIYGGTVPKYAEAIKEYIDGL
jgi:predicted ATP-grasp superfamily ATP-dependent carboligase